MAPQFEICSECGREVASPEERNECSDCGKIVCRTCSPEETAEGKIVYICTDCEEAKG